MSRSPALVLLVALALIVPAGAFAQLTPPAGSAGAGNSAISGVPFGPANPRALSDPSGIGNAANTRRSAPTLHRRPPPTARSIPRRRAHASRRRPMQARRSGSSAASSYPRKPPVRRRARPEVSSFTGICRGVSDRIARSAGSDARKKTDISMSGHRGEQFSLAGLMCKVELSGHAADPACRVSCDAKFALGAGMAGMNIQQRTAKTVSVPDTVRRSGSRPSAP